MSSKRRLIPGKPAYGRPLSLLAAYLLLLPSSSLLRGGGNDTQLAAVPGGALRPHEVVRWPTVASVIKDDMFDSRKAGMKRLVRHELLGPAFKMRYLEASLVAPGQPYADGTSIDPSRVLDHGLVTDPMKGKVVAVLSKGPYAVVMLGPAGSGKQELLLRELPRVLADNRWPDAEAFHLVSSSLTRQLSKTWHRFSGLARAGSAGSLGFADLWDGYFKGAAGEFRRLLLQGLLGTRRNLLLMDTGASDFADSSSMATTRGLLSHLQSQGYEIVVMAAYASAARCATRVLRGPFAHDRNSDETGSSSSSSSSSEALPAAAPVRVEGKQYRGQQTWAVSTFAIPATINWCRRSGVGAGKRFYLFDEESHRASIIQPNDGLRLSRKVMQESRYGRDHQVERDWDITRARTASLELVPDMWVDRAAADEAAARLASEASEEAGNDGPAGPEATLEWAGQVADAAKLAIAATEKNRTVLCAEDVPVPVWACRRSLLDDDGEAELDDAAIARARRAVARALRSQQARHAGLQAEAQQAALASRLEKAMADEHEGLPESAERQDEARLEAKRVARTVINGWKAAGKRVTAQGTLAVPPT